MNCRSRKYAYDWGTGGGKKTRCCPLSLSHNFCIQSCCHKKPNGPFKTLKAFPTKALVVDGVSIWISDWFLFRSFFRVQVQSQESAGVMHYLSGGAWDPHDMNAVAATCESSIQFWDLRTMKYVFFWYYVIALLLFVNQDQHERP